MNNHEKRLFGHLHESLDSLFEMFEAIERDLQRAGELNEKNQITISHLHAEIGALKYDQDIS